MANFNRQAGQLAVAQAEDVYDLLSHIAWTDVVKPRLDEEVRQLNTLIVSNMMGTPLPGTLTKEQLAMRAGGITYILSLFERILRQGEKALENLDAHGLLKG
jgi:hypothetical protein